MYSKHDPSTRREMTTIGVFASLLIVAFLALVGRCFYLQYAKADYYSAQCVKQQCAYLPLEPQRGTILDCRGRVLAASNRMRQVFAEPRAIKDPKETSNELAPILDMAAHEICKRIVQSGTPGYVLIKSDATERECDAARDVSGAGVQDSWKRHYPTGALAWQVVGYANAYNQGLGGIEYQFDSQLRGKGAKDAFFVDVQRRPLSFSVENQETDNGMPTNGNSVILTLDATIQQFAREALIHQYREFEAEGALAVVADPQTGAILAMVSLPDFDPTQARPDPNSFYNRVLTDQFEPGSIIKPVVAAIALDTKAVNTTEIFFCENGNYYGKGFGRISEYREGFGNLTLRGILVHSSNIGMAKVGQRVGAERLYEGLTLFGFGKKLGIELPGEAEGLLRPAKDWTGYSVTRIPFGQEISVTALQMVRAFCLLANGGRSVRLHLVKALVQPDGSMIDMRPPALRVGYVIRPGVARWVVGDALTGVIEEGTGKNVRLDKWRVFGKTGTAQIARRDGSGYEEHAYIASFIGGAPAENPQVVVMVSIRRPNASLHKGYTGGTVAGPAAKEILEKTLTYLSETERLTNRPSIARLVSSGL
jgi:cell division protein FtsI/penicillin-binding protein 2